MGDYTVNIPLDLDENAKEWLGKLKVDLNDLTTEVQEQPAFYGWVGTLSAQAKKEKTKIKLDLQIVENTIRRELRLQHPPGTRGGPTTDDITAMTKADSRYLQVMAELIRCEEIYDKLEAYREGFRQKADMLKLLSDQVRRESQFKSGM